MSDHRFPNHIAIIMDGNGRWAQARGLPRTAGHQRGVEAVKRVVKDAAEMGVKYLTLFGFSTENWSRPVDEVKELMRLLRMYLRAETAELHASNIRLKIIGNRAELESDIVALIEQAEDLTKDNTAITVVIALNYGGRHDILNAAARMAAAMQEKGVVPSYESAEEFFPQFLSTAGIPDPDILIRTSGEQRISNFLLWQCAYAEMVYAQTLWPDFSKTDLEAAVAEFKGRDRRFGGLGAGRG
ncbi:MAG: isoprenyl transferase [Micavibrio aeruginosavorus]|nr:isoprenyl transferase [Micavibrio aeruginosavorus]